jgi:hypothetical protein
MYSTHRWLSRAVALSIVTLCVFYCACEGEEDDDETSTDEQFGSNLQGSNLQGSNLQGSNLQGMSMQGFKLDGATLGGAPLTNVRVEHGELVAEQNQVTLHGTALKYAHLLAQVRNLDVDPPATAVVEYRITDIVAEDSKYDPTYTGSTYLYTLEQWVDDSGSWQPACPPDLDNLRVAIPVAAIWDETGARIESTTLFTLACTTGVIAKCYRWGYRPWVTGYGDLTTMHWTCTRLARADYCGDGVSHTYDGTLINVWDNLPAPGPIQTHGGESPLIPTIPGMVFEAGWNTSGNVCLSHARWLTIGWLLAGVCPDHLLECNDPTAALGLSPSVHLFNETYPNAGL